MKLTVIRDLFIRDRRDGKEYGTRRRKALAPRSQKIYYDRIELFIAHLLYRERKATTQQFSAQAVADYLRYRADELGLAKNTLYMDANALREFARWGVRKRYWSQEAIDGFPSVDRPMSVPRAYGNAERDRLMSLPLTAPEDGLLRALLYYAALRNGEVRGLRLKDVTPPYDLPGGERIPGKLYVQGKGARERVVDMHPMLWQALEAYLKTVPAGALLSGPLLAKDDGTAWSERMVANRVRAWGRRVDVPKPQAHRFRHTTASDMLEADKALDVIQKILGHSSLATTQIYLKTSDKRKADAIASLPSFGAVDSRPGCQMPESDESHPPVTADQETEKR